MVGLATPLPASSWRHRSSMTWQADCCLLDSQSYMMPLASKCLPHSDPSASAAMQESHSAYGQCAVGVPVYSHSHQAGHELRHQRNCKRVCSAVEAPVAAAAAEEELRLQSAVTSPLETSRQHHCKLDSHMKQRRRRSLAISPRSQLLLRTATWN